MIKDTWHDLGPIETLKNMAPLNELEWFDELYNLSHNELDKKLKWIERSTKSLQLKKVIYAHRHSEFFLKCKPDSFKE